MYQNKHIKNTDDWRNGFLRIAETFHQTTQRHILKTAFFIWSIQPDNTDSSFVLNVRILYHPTWRHDLLDNIFQSHRHDNLKIYR